LWEEYEEDKAKFRKEAREEGLAEGRTEGLAEGRTEGLAEGRKQERLSAIKSLMDTMKLTAQQAMDALKIPLSEQKNYQGML
jgi:flagellar biosynthesis/type III secretory pathway protein FliH